MADIINLRQARKERDRADRARQAEENRAKFGRTKAERRRDLAEIESLRKTVDGAKREDADQGDKDGA